MPRGTRRFVWRVVLASRRGEVVVEGAFGSGHPVRWMDPVSGVGRARSSGQPEGRGSISVWLCLVWRLVARGSSGGTRVTSDVLGGRTVVRSAICGVLGGCGLGRGRWVSRPPTIGELTRFVGSWFERFPVPEHRGEHAGRVAVVATRRWPRTSTIAPIISVIEPHRLTCSRSFGAGCVEATRCVCLSRLRRCVDDIVHGSALSRGNQGFRGSRVGGNHSLAATPGREVQPKPTRPGTRLGRR